MRYLVCISLSFLFFSSLLAQVFLGPKGEMFRLRVMADHLSDPWEITCGPDNQVWVTEAKGYRVSTIDPATGRKTVLLDLTNERAFPRYDKLAEKAGNKPWPQGGLMGLALHPGLLKDKPYVYLSYLYRFSGAADTGRGCKLNYGGCYFTTRIVRYEYNRAAQKLEHPEILCDTIPGSSDHNGGRLTLAPVNGKIYLYYGIGDMGAGQFDNSGRPNHAQQKEVWEGKILRFNTEPDGDAGRFDRWIPNDNPFNDRRQSAVYSYGHRNVQGLVYGMVAGTGRLYESEHGPYSDDEINVIEKGMNYGHPLVIGYADGNYNGFASSVTPYKEVPGRWHTSYPLIVSEQENASRIGAAYRDPLKTFYPNSHDFLQHLFDRISAGDTRPEWNSEAPSSLDLYTSDAIPGWKNSLLLPSLKHGHLMRVSLNEEGNAIASDTMMYFTLPVRFRDLAISGDGKKIWVCTDSAAISSGPSRMNPKTISYMGSILEFTYEGIKAPQIERAAADTIISRYRQYFLRSASLPAVDEYVARCGFKLTANNQWPDINYADTSPSFWPTRDHLGRVKEFALAWVSQGSKYYHDTLVWQTLSKALDNWLEKRYQNSNWWVNEIGVPQDMRDVLSLIAHDLSPAQRQGALEVLNQHKVRGVGANLIWSADLAIHYGALTGNEDLIRRNRDLIGKEIKVTKEDGIQPDASYHQHGARLQIYHYGLSYLETNVRIAWEMHGTPWSFPADKIAILTDFIVNGWQWMSRGINIVPGTIDRAASRPDQLHNADIRYLIPYLSELSPENKAVFDAIAARQNGGGQALTGFRYYPQSDFAVYQQKDFAYFLKTVSTRTLNSESINTENLKGRLLNNGDGYLIAKGNEYFNLLPFWDWNFLPGQTNYNHSADSIVRTPFAGSVTDQQSGMTAMVYKTNRLSARKMWACYNNKVVCLISGLRDEGSADSVFTALDQSRWQTPVWVSNYDSVFTNPGSFLLKKVKWLQHSSFGFIFLRPSTVNLRLGMVSGSWSTINQSAPATMLQEKVFLPRLYHEAGTTSSGYVLVPSTDPHMLEAIAQKPDWQVVSNDSLSQCVRFAGGTVMAVFYSAGAVNAGGVSLKADRPCLLQMKTGSFYLSDPMQEGGKVVIHIGSRKYSVQLPPDGSTVVVKR